MALATCGALAPCSRVLGLCSAGDWRPHQVICRASWKSETRLARDDLLRLIEKEERGVKTQGNAQKRAQIVKAIEALGVEGRDQTTTDEALSGTWRMLWTTEKEQLFIVEKLAPLFGTQAGDILQVIEVQSGTLNNVITFPPAGAFVVDSTIQVVSKQRVNFKFVGAALWLQGRRIAVPPFGQGWFETLYLDDSVRVAKDIRGDFLVVDRAPQPWLPPAPSSA